MELINPFFTLAKIESGDMNIELSRIDICEICRESILDFYEIPLRLEGNSNGIYGFVNVMHIRAIDRKRIDSKCLGIATDKCFDNIIKAINKNLSF